MLSAIHIDGFKSLRSSRVELGTVNVFIGANGSGKSNLLEALGVASAAAYGTVDPESLKRRGVRPGLPVLYKASFQGRRIPRLIKIGIETDEASYLLGLDNPTTSKVGPWRVHSETLREGTEEILTRSPRGCSARVREPGSQKWRKVKLSPPPYETAVRTALQQVEEARRARTLIDALVEYGIYAPTTPVLRGLSEDVTRDPVGLAGSGLPSAMTDLFSLWKQPESDFDSDELWELVDWADRIAVKRPEEASVSPSVNVGRIVLRFQDRFMAAKRNTLSAYDASEGALYVLFLLVLTMHPRSPRLFAVDNFDHALHPRLAARLTRLVADALVERGDRQMLLTTHNPLVLDGLDLSNPAIRLFAVERARGSGDTEGSGEVPAPGETLIRRIELSGNLLREVNRGLSLSRLWVSGRLGAVPRVL